MYVVRDVFTAKPGMASKLARMFTDTRSLFANRKMRVLTDVVAGYNTVVLEAEIANLGEFERDMKEYMEKPELRQMMAGYTELWLTGHREILRIVE